MTLPHDHRAVPHQGRRADPPHHPRPARQALALADYNLFRLRAEDVLIDLLTDSGTGAMSLAPVGGHDGGDESYAGRAALLPLRGRRPRHLRLPSTSSPRTRAALPSASSSACLLRPGDVVPSNTHFDTTRANIEARGREALDLPDPRGRATREPPPLQGQHRPRPRSRQTLAQAGRADPARDDHRHQQLRRRPAGLHGEHPGGQRALPRATASRSSSTPAASPRTPGSSSCASRATPTRRRSEIAREMFSLRRRLHDERQEGRLVNIGGFLALNDDGLGRALPRPPDPHRGLPDLRRPRRLRPRGHRRRACTRRSTRTTCATASARSPTSASG